MDTVGHKELDSDTGGGGACLQVLATRLERHWNRESSSRGNVPIPLPWQVVAWKHFLPSLQSPYWPQVFPLYCSERSGSGAPKDWVRTEERTMVSTPIHRPGSGKHEYPEAWKMPWKWEQTLSNEETPAPGLFPAGLSPALHSRNGDTTPKPQNPLTSFMGQADNLTMNHTLFYEKRLSSSFCSLDMSNITCFKLKNQF